MLILSESWQGRLCGYCVAPTLGAVHCKVALLMALKKINRRTAKALIHHSDRGIQYCSAIYIGLLDAYHVKISMTETGNPLENPIAERVNAGPPVRHP